MFNPSRHVYNLTESSFRRWRAALAGALAGTGTWSWSNNGPYGTAGSQRATRYSSTPVSTVTFTPKADCDLFTIHYIENSYTGVLPARGDGGAAVARDAYAASNTARDLAVPAGASGVALHHHHRPTDRKGYGDITSAVLDVVLRSISPSNRPVPGRPTCRLRRSSAELVV